MEDLDLMAFGAHLIRPHVMSLGVRGNNTRGHGKRGATATQPREAFVESRLMLS
jgi:hypothetical protein